MIRVWIPATFWEGVVGGADGNRVRAIKRGGARVQVAASAGGIEWIRQVASRQVREAFAQPEAHPPGRVRAAQLTLAALSRLGWRPIADESTLIYRPRNGRVRVDASVVGRVRCAWLQELVLMPDVPERQGHGSAALRDALTWAEAQGAEVMRLLAPKPTVGFWLRHGFVVASVDVGGRMRMVRAIGDQGAGDEALLRSDSLPRCGNG